MSERKRRTEENIEDVQRISDTLNRKVRKGKRRNPFLKPYGGFDLIERFPGYEKKKIKKIERKRRKTEIINTGH